MSVHFDKVKINNALQDFYTATGVRIDLFDADFRPVTVGGGEANDYCNLIQSTAVGKRACIHSDECMLGRSMTTKQTQHHICHAGLINTTVPIIYREEIIGYLLMGKMRVDNDFSLAMNCADKFGLDPDRAFALYRDIPAIDNAVLESISNIAVMLVKYILNENMMTSDLGENIQRAVEHINDNLAGELSVNSVCKSANISKSVLYKKFHDRFGCTLSEYINKRRIQESMKLLRSTSMSIEEISQSVGFSSASYYSKMFKKQTGVSPLRYKKQ